MKKVISAALLALCLSNPLFAKWLMIPLDELVADSDLIVIGTLNSATENSKGLGKGYIVVEQILTNGANRLDGVPLKQGDNLKITWEDNWACAAGMHRARENNVGIYLLEVQKDGTVTAAYPGRFRSINDLHEIEVLQRRTPTKELDRVDVLFEIEKHIPVDSVESPNLDVSPFSDYSPFNAFLTAILSLGLYLILYKSRLRIR